MTKGRTWVLDTETKGTGAQMVPLDAVEPKKEPGRDRMWVPPKRRPKEATPPAPPAPRRFRVVEVVTRRVLQEDAGVRETLELLGRVERMLDVNLSVWETDGQRWRLLSLAEQQVAWDRRRRPGPGV
jgi:hypothetical protein